MIGYTTDRSKFKEVDVKSDYQSFSMDIRFRENIQILNDIKSIISSCHNSISKNDVHKHIGLIELLQKEYPKILEKITNEEFRNKLRDKIKAIISGMNLNDSLSDGEKTKLKDWFDTQFDSIDFKSKINVNTESEISEINEDDITHVYGSILGNDTLIQQLSNKINAITKSFFANHVNNTFDRINRYIISNDKRIKQIKFQCDMINGIKDNIKNTGFSLQDRFILNSKLKFIDRYNKYVVSRFTHNIKKIEGKDLDELVRNTLSRKMAVKILRKITKPVYLVKKAMKNLKSKRFWKLQLKKLIKNTSSFSMSVIKFFAKTIFNALRFSITAIVNPSGLAKLLRSVAPVPFKILKGSYKLIKNILKLSVKLLKSVTSGLWKLFKGVQIFFMSPPGAYILGFVCGMIYNGVIRLFDYIKGEFKQKSGKWIDDKIKEIKDFDKKMYEEHPYYAVIRDDISKIVDYLSVKQEAIMKKMNEYGFDVNEILSSRDKDKRRVLMKQFSDKLYEDFKVDEIKNRLLGFGTDVLEKTLGVMEKIQNMFITGEVDYLLRTSGDIFENYTSISVSNPIVKVATGNAIKIIGTLIGSVGGPVGAIVGGVIAGMISSTVQNLMMKTPYSDGDRAKYENGIVEELVKRRGLQGSQFDYLGLDSEQLQHNKEQMNKLERSIVMLQQQRYELIMQGKIDEAKNILNEKFRLKSELSELKLQEWSTFDELKNNRTKQYEETVNLLLSQPLEKLGSIDLNNIIGLLEREIKVSELSEDGDIIHGMLVKTFLENYIKNKLLPKMSSGSINLRMFWNLVNGQIKHIHVNDAEGKLRNDALNESLRQYKRYDGDRRRSDEELLNMFRQDVKSGKSMHFGYSSFESKEFEQQNLDFSMDRITDNFIKKSLNKTLKDNDFDSRLLRFVTKDVLINYMVSHNKTSINGISDNDRKNIIDKITKTFNTMKETRQKTDIHRNIVKTVGDKMISLFSVANSSIKDDKKRYELQQKLKDIASEHNIDVNTEEIDHAFFESEEAKKYHELEKQRIYKEEKLHAIEKYIRDVQPLMIYTRKEDERRKRSFEAQVPYMVNPFASHILLGIGEKKHEDGDISYLYNGYQ